MTHLSDQNFEEEKQKIYLNSSGRSGNFGCPEKQGVHKQTLNVGFFQHGLVRQGLSDKARHLTEAFLSVLVVSSRVSDLRQVVDAGKLGNERCVDIQGASVEKFEDHAVQLFGLGQANGIAFEVVGQR